MALQLQGFENFNHIQFFAVTDGVVIASLGVIHSDQCSFSLVKSGWLIRASQMVKIPLQKTSTSTYHCWNNYSYCLIGTSSSVLVKQINCSVKIRLGFANKILVRRLSGERKVYHEALKNLVFTEIPRRGLTICPLPFVQGIVLRKFPFCIRYLIPKTTTSTLLIPEVRHSWLCSTNEFNTLLILRIKLRRWKMRSRTG